MLGVLELGESFDSCITTTLTLCRLKNSHNSVSLLPMPLVLNCMMVNEFPSTACVGIDVGRGCSFGRVGGWGTARAAYPVLNSSVSYCVLKTRTLRINPSRTTIAKIAHPTTRDIANTHRTWILSSRARVLVYISFMSNESA